MQPSTHLARHDVPFRPLVRLVRIQTLLLALMLALVIGGCTKTTHAAGEDEAAVRAAMQQFYAALNAGVFGGDVEPMKQVWSHAADVTYMGPFGGMQVGWTQVLATWEEQTAMKITGEIKPRDIHVKVGRDLAVIQNFEEGKNTDADGNTHDVSIRVTNIFRKEDGKWKMISHHTDLILGLKK